MSSANFWDTLYDTTSYVLIFAEMGWAAFWAGIFTNTSGHPVHAGLPDFSRYNIPKREKIYQMTTKYTNWPLNISNGHKINQVLIKYTKIFYYKAHQNLPKLGFLV
jgi:hypothetical protein